jgi:hypothetical protein
MTRFEMEPSDDEDDDDDDMEGEKIGLMVPSSGPHRILVARRDKLNHHREYISAVLIIVPLVVLSLWGAGHWKGYEVGLEGSDKEVTDMFCKSDMAAAPILIQSNDTDKDAVFRFACPCTNSTSISNADQNARYSKANLRIVQNVSNYLSIFRNMEFDDWGHSYEEVKKGSFHWKSTYFAELKDNSTMYESACGIGMNLFMTLDILQELMVAKNIVVYGNDHDPESVRVANDIARRRVLPAGGQLGTICEGDSTKLQHVPSGRFDLVFTGHISPLQDPLGLNLETADENYAVYKALCEKQDEESKHKIRQAQNRQNRWYAEWVQEMIRIAKPGASVIAEQVSNP